VEPFSGSAIVVNDIFVSLSQSQIPASLFLGQGHSRLPPLPPFGDSVGTERFGSLGRFSSIGLPPFLPVFRFRTATCQRQGGRFMRFTPKAVYYHILSLIDTLARRLLGLQRC